MIRIVQKALLALGGAAVLAAIPLGHAYWDAYTVWAALPAVSVPAGMSPADWRASAKTAFLCTSERLYEKNGALRQEIAHEYDDAGREVRMILRGYDERGQIILEQHTIYEYGPDGRPCAAVITGMANGKPLAEERRTYTAQPDGGQLVVSGDGMSWRNDAAGNTVEYRSGSLLVRQEFDASGDMTRLINEMSDADTEPLIAEFIYTDHPDGTRTQTMRKLNDGGAVTTLLEYDVHGNCIRRTALDENGTAASWEERTYIARRQ